VTRGRCWPQGSGPGAPPYGARAGKGFTGIDQPYEAPDNPVVVVKAVEKSVPEC
jgi:hypothetical protein